MESRRNHEITENLELIETFVCSSVIVNKYTYDEYLVLQGERYYFWISLRVKKAF